MSVELDFSDLNFAEVLEFSCNRPSCENEDIGSFAGSYHEFFTKHMMLNQPCIIHNVAKDWNCSKHWVITNKPNTRYLNEIYGTAEVPVADCNEKFYNAQTKISMRFSEFIKYWEELMDKNHPESLPCWYLKDWHFTKDFPDENVYQVPPEFSSDWLNEYFVEQESLKDDYRFVYMGPKGSWTPFHADVFTSYSWSVNVCGQKKWILLPPGEEDKLKDSLNNLPYDIEFLDQEEMNERVKFYKIIQNPSDAIFVPSGWHHQVWNLADTISINHNWINGCNIDSMWQSMKRNLKDVKKEIQEFEQSMENWQQHCQLLLKSCFGMDYREFFKFLRFIQHKRQRHLDDAICGFQVYGGWKLGKHHLLFDFRKASEMLKIFLNDGDTKELIRVGYIDVSKEGEKM